MLLISAITKPEGDTYPNYFPAPKYKLPEHKDSSLIYLGRTLFYDPLLSIDGKISCASCHSPYNAFAHSDHKLSHGVYDRIGKRNAPALFNLAWQERYMWDGAAHTIEVQPLVPINIYHEMGDNTINLLRKLNNKSFYTQKFKNIFGDSVIDSKNMLTALAAFQLSLVSANAKYDAMQRGELQFSDQELRGYQLFLSHCNACHTEPLFSNYHFASNGLPIDKLHPDYGRYEITRNPLDSLRFKTPSLRNIEYSAPYMHDGRFATLRSVINFYNDRIISPHALSNEEKKSIQLSPEEKTDLIAFLLTLSDKNFIFDPKNGFPKEMIPYFQNK